MSLTLALITGLLISSARADCNDGWSSCDASIWVSPKFAGEHPDVLGSYTPGEIRGPLEYEIKFSCRGRRAGYYADLDHGCRVWHYCNTTRELNTINGLSTWTYMHFSYACTEEGTRYDQVLKECIPESRALVSCRESELYYPTGEYVHDVPITIQSNNRLVPVRCPQSPVRCQVQKDHIKLSSCPDAPGAVVKFYTEVSNSDVPATGPALAYGVRELTSATSNSDEEGVLDEESGSNDEPSDPAPLAPNVPRAPSKVTFHAVKETADKINDASKTNTQRFRQTPAAAARKTIQARGQSKHQAPVRRITVVQTQEPIRKIYVSDVGTKQQIEESKVSHAYSTKSSSIMSRKTIESPAVSQVKTSFYSEGKEEHSFPFIASHQVIYPRRLTENGGLPAILSVQDEASGTRANSSESAEADFLGLPIGSTRILGEKIDTSFDCTGKTYGYYADVKNQCKVYHVCSPKTDEFGVKYYEHYSFVCAEGLVFDQQQLTCLPAAQSSTVCAESERFFTRTAAVFEEGNDAWRRKAATTTPSPLPDSSVQPVYVDVIPGEPLLASGRKSVVQIAEKTVASDYAFASPSRVLKGRHSQTSQTSEEQSYVREQAEQESLTEQQSNQDDRKVVVNQYIPAAGVKYPADNSENGQGHRPSITQRIVRVGGQRIFHNPRITQRVQSPGSPAGSQEVSHNPAINQYISQPGQPTGLRTIAHNPSITQYVSQPGSPSDDKIISHNPSITQYIPAPAAPAAGDQVISHNPSITQYVAGPGVQIPSSQRISHNPTISQYIPLAGTTGPNSQSISHTPTINQVISLSEYARPSGRSS